MQWPDQARMEVLPYRRGFDMDNLLKELCEGGFEFVLIAHPDKADEIHRLF